VSNRHLLIVDLPHVTRDAGQHYLDIHFTFVRVSYLTIVERQRLLPLSFWGFALRKQVSWLCLVEDRRMVLLLPQWISTLRSFIYQDVGEPTSHQGSSLEWQKAITSIWLTWRHVGRFYVIFAMALRSSTERLGDFWMREVSLSLVGVFCVVLLFVFCFFCLLRFHWHLAFLFTYSPISGNSQSKTTRFYRLSFERARHGHKKKRCPDGRPSVSYKWVKMSQNHWIYISK